MLSFIPDVVKLPAAIILSLVVGFGAGTWHGKRVGRAEAAADAAREAVDRINNLEKNNANFRNLPARERCLVFMRDSGLPESGCD